VLGPVEVKSGPSGKRLPPAGEGRGDRQLPSGLSLPQVIEIREEDWGKHRFDKYSALKVIQSGEGEYDFYVNMDNVYLQTEIKSYESKLDARLLEARFKYGLVLLGLAVLKESNKENDYEDDETIEERVFNVTKAVAPVLLPMIESLGDLSVEEQEQELAEYEEVKESQAEYVADLGDVEFCA
jgi:hypothetical protein